MEGKNKNKSFWWFFTGVVISFLGVLAVTLLVSDTAVAQVGTGNFGPTFGLGTADLQSTIINIVQWALGFLGLVAVIMIIYGGFVWMTAGGNQEKVAKAKKIITRAVIGLVIVLLAWAIVLWVFNFINDVTNPPAPCTDGDVRLPCELCVGGVYVWQFSWDSCGTGTTPFYVEMVDPGENETNVVLCSMVQAVFNDEIDQTTIDPDPNTGNVRVVVFGGAIGGTPCVQNKECFSGVCTAGQCVGEVVSGAWSVFNTPEPKGILYYQADDDYIENTWYEVQLLPGIASLNAALSPFTGKVWQFETGSETLEFPPTVTQIYPFDAENGICLSTAIQAKFSSKMMLPSMTHRMCSGGNDACDLDADCPAAETCEGTILLEAIAPVVPTALGGVSYPNFQSFSTRPAELLEPGRQYNVTLKAGVPGTFFGIQDVCGNHLDGDYNQMDDGSPGDNFMGVVPPDPPGGIPPWDFTADTDTTNTICLPEITSINPSNGMYDNAAGNVDITGSNFGITGKVYFNKKVININTCFDGTEFPGFGDCVSAWTPTSITVHTPGGPILFPDNEPSIGAKDGPVTVDVSPGVCVGGANDGRSCNIPADCPDGTCRSDSNGMGFDVISAQITEVSGRGGLEHGGIGQYVSIIKRNDGNGGFGDIKGKVFFRKLSPPIIGDEIEAPFPPDPPCTETWFDDYIVIKVPDMGSTGQTTCDTSVFNWWECPAAYDVGIQVEKSDGTRSNIIKFHYTDELPGPGVCNIAPQNCGTNPEPRTLQGEEFQSYDAVESKVLFQLGFDPEVEANVPNPPVDWDNLFVNFEVPNIDNAKGYRVWLKNPVDFSNRLPFNVPCGAIPEVVEDSSCGARCDAMAPNPGAPCTTNFDCANFPCNIDMASPHPWPNLQDVCLNAAFGARFTVDMEQTSLTSTNIFLEQCDDSVCTNVIDTPDGTFSYPSTDDFVFMPDNDLLMDTYYRMTILRDVRSTDGVKMNYDYQWIIKTKTDTEPCPIETLFVTPPFYMSVMPPPEDIGYMSYPFGPNCVVLDPSDYIFSWSSDDVGVATVMDIPAWGTIASTVAKGATYINSQVDTIQGRGRLVVDPDSCKFQEPDYCADPNQDGILECNGSTCNIFEDRCTPVMIDKTSDGFFITPPSGPSGTMISIEGCWFGDAQGEVIVGGLPATYECANSWTNNLIVATTPALGNGTHLVDVQRVGLPLFSTALPSTPPNSFGSGQQNPAIYGFSVGGVCARLCDAVSTNKYDYCLVDADCTGGSCLAGVFPPPLGTPGVCPPLQPSVGREGSLVYANGYNLLNGGNTNNTRVYWTEGLEDTWLDVSNRAAPDNVWTIDEINRTMVPITTVSGSSNVQVNNCPSNSLPFNISCNGNSDCSTGCCQSNICVGWENCAPGDPEDPCHLPANTANNGSCAPPAPTISKDFYRCLDSEGHLDPVPLPNPVSRPYDPPPAIDDCRVCCDPDKNNDDVLDDPMTNLAGLTCVADKGLCNGAPQERGLYCGCVYDAANPGPGDLQCGDPPSMGCGSDTCCYTRPKVFSVSPPPFPAEVECTNTVMEVIFDQIMDRDSLNTTNITITDGGGVPIDGNISTSWYGFRFYPSALFTPNTFVNIDINGEVKNKYAVRIAGPQAINWHISATATICNIDHISFLVETTFSPPTYAPPDLFSCALDDGCTGDIDPAPNSGNQHILWARAEDAIGTPLAATYTFSELDEINSIELQADPNPDSEVVKANNQNGRAYVDVEAQAMFFSDSMTGRAVVNVFLCENPWPNPFNPDFDDYPYEDSFSFMRPDSVNGINDYITNYSIWYCRDEGNLPALNRTTEVVVREGAPSQAGVDELIKEYFFLRPGPPDGIGIRLMENENFKSPRQWYIDQFGSAAPAPQEILVDGYQAVRAGRTVYVSAPNLECLDAATNKVPCDGSGGPVATADLVPYIYLLSYSEDAAEEMINVYNQMLKNWVFNINMEAEDKSRVQRDMRRLNDLAEVYEKMLIYKDRNGSFPKLEGGTFVPAMTMSTWPSWQETFGQELIPISYAPRHDKFVQAFKEFLVKTASAQTSLPVDPINEMYLCPFAYIQEEGREFEFNNDVYPTGITHDGQGNVYMVNWDSNPEKGLYKCDGGFSSCQKVWTAPDQANQYPTDVSIDKTNGDILIAVAGWVGAGGRVYRFNPNDFSAPKEEYVIPMAINVETDREGNLYVTRNNWNAGIYKYNPDGTGPVASFDTGGNCAIPGSPCPSGIYVDDDEGVIFAADAGRLSVVKYDIDLTSIVGMLNLGEGVVKVDVLGDSVFATEHFSNHVTELDKDLTKIKNRITNDQIRNPYGISVFDGGFYFANYTEHKVNKYIYDSASANACWDAMNKIASCPPGSYVYMYKAIANADNANMYANLEYEGLGSWANPGLPDPCDPPHTCPCFDYEFNATGTLLDHVPPIINSVGSPPLNMGVPNVVNGTRVLDVDVVDPPPDASGVAKVEFYIDGIKVFTDEDGGGGWSWSFNSTNYSDGDHILKVIAYDNATNHAEVIFDIIVANANGPDSSPPFAVFLSPNDGDNISGDVVISAQGSDNQVITSLSVQVKNEPVANTCWGTASTLNCQVVWDSDAVDGDENAIYQNKKYTLWATATDAATLTYQAEIKVNLNNSDATAPTITITAPSAGETISGIYNVTADALDSFGVVKVEFYVDGVLVGSGKDPDHDDEWVFYWDTTLQENGVRSLAAYAFDAQDNSASDIINVVLDNVADDTEPPEVEFLRPNTPAYAATVNGLITIDVSASDNKGVLKVNFYQDYIIRTVDNSPPWSWTVDTDKISAGWHSFQVDALDAAGNRSDAIELRLNIRGEGGPICGDAIISDFIGEECDFDGMGGFNLDGEDCTSLGHYCGVLACDMTDCTFDETACVDGSCGDTTRQAVCGEQCDLPDWGACSATSSCHSRSCVNCACFNTLNCSLCDQAPWGNWCTWCFSCTLGKVAYDAMNTTCGDFCTLCPAHADCNLPTCPGGASPGDERCNAGPPIHTEECADIGGGNYDWVDEPLTVADCGTRRWDGDCTKAVGANSCFWTGSSCQVSGGNAYCQGAAGTIKCDGTCNVDWPDVFNNCCANICGNNIIEPPGEECEPGPPEDLNGETCITQGHTAGDLHCYGVGQPLECEFDDTLCTDVTCGNGVIDPGEDCEPGPPLNLNGQTCITLGHGPGTLSCNPAGGANECKFNTTQCSCANGTERCGPTPTYSQECVANNWVNEPQSTPVNAVGTYWIWEGFCDGAWSNCLSAWGCKDSSIDSVCEAWEIPGGAGCTTNCYNEWPEFYCEACDSCVDGQMNCGETGVDTGGPCGAATCQDTCAGCCTGVNPGDCQPGTTNPLCGTGGANCAACPACTTCAGGSCQPVACGAADGCCPAGCDSVDDVDCKPVYRVEFSWNAPSTYQGHLHLTNLGGSIEHLYWNVAGQKRNNSYMFPPGVNSQTFHVGIDGSLLTGVTYNIIVERVVGGLTYEGDPVVRVYDSNDTLIDTFTSGGVRGHDDFWRVAENHDYATWETCSGHTGKAIGNWSTYHSCPFIVKEYDYSSTTNQYIRSMGIFNLTHLAAIDMRSEEIFRRIVGPVDTSGALWSHEFSTSTKWAPQLEGYMGNLYWGYSEGSTARMRRIDINWQEDAGWGWDSILPNLEPYVADMVTDSGLLYFITSGSGGNGYMALRRINNIGVVDFLCGHNGAGDTQASGAGMDVAWSGDIWYVRNKNTCADFAISHYDVSANACGNFAFTYSGCASDVKEYNGQLFISRYGTDQTLVLGDPNSAFQGTFYPAGHDSTNMDTLVDTDGNEKLFIGGDRIYYVDGNDWNLFNYMSTGNAAIETFNGKIFFGREAIGVWVYDPNAGPIHP